MRCCVDLVRRCVNLRRYDSNVCCERCAARAWQHHLRHAYHMPYHRSALQVRGSMPRCKHLPSVGRVAMGCTYTKLSKNLQCNAEDRKAREFFLASSPRIITSSRTKPVSKSYGVVSVLGFLVRHRNKETKTAFNLFFFSAPCRASCQCRTPKRH